MIPRDVVAGVATQRGPAPLLAAGPREAARGLGTSRLRSARSPQGGRSSATMRLPYRLWKRQADLIREMPHGRPRGAAAHASPLRSGFAGCRHIALRRQFCSQGRLHLINTSFCAASRTNKRGPWPGRTAVPLRSTPGLPGQAVHPRIYFFLFRGLWPPEQKEFNRGHPAD